MPKFIDHHRGLSLSYENTEQSKTMIQSGMVTERGVKALNGFTSADGKEAAIAVHCKAHGILADEVVEVSEGS